MGFVGKIYTIQERKIECTGHSILEKTTIPARKHE
jgi:hypothetical protein